MPSEKDNEAAATETGTSRSASRHTEAEAEERRLTRRDMARGADSPPEQDRGRSAKKPTEVPRPGWKDILWRTRRQLAADNLSVVAAGVAFYAFVAIVPALTATLALYAFFSDTSRVMSDLAALREVVPAEAMPILEQQVTRMVQNEEAAGLSAIIGLLIAIYGSAKATKAMISGLNIAYDEEEKRNWFKLNLTAVLLTAAGIVGLIVAVSLVAVLPAVVSSMGIAAGSGLWLKIIRWPVLLLLFMGGLSVLYRFAPSRETPQWRWVSWGAAAAALLWLLGSAAFSYYVSSFGNYEETYGSLGAIVIFLFWLMLTAFSVLFGAELNAEMERQTARDTTTGQEKPLGERGAYVADTIGASCPEGRPGKRSHAKEPKSGKRKAKP